MNASAAGSSPAATAKGGSARLLILLGLLAVMLGALGYDKFYAGPEKDKAKDRIDDANNTKSAAPVDLEARAKDPTSMKFTNKDVREAIGFAPKWTKKVDYETWECYAWWGPIPLNRNYLIVRYHGDKTLVFRDYLDGELPKKDLPPPTGGDPLAATPAMGPPMGRGGPPGGKSGKSGDGEKTEPAEGDAERKPEATEKSKEPGDPFAAQEAADKPAAEKAKDVKPEEKKPEEKPKSDE